MNSSNEYYHGAYIGLGEFDPITNPWTVGTYNVPICYGDLTDDLPVTILENKAEKIEILKLGITDYTLGDPEYFVQSGDGWVMNAYDYSDYELKVTYTDGTSKIFTQADETDFRGLFPLLNNSIIEGDVEQKVHTTTGKNKVYVLYMGCVGEYEINVVEQAVVNGNASVSDATVEKALEESKGDTVVLDATGSATNQTSSVKLPTTSVEKLAEENVDLVVKLDSATVTLDAKAVTAIADQAGDAVTITLVLDETAVEDLTEKQQAALENENVEVILTALVLADGKPIGDFKGGSVKVQIAFTPESGYDYTVKYVADDGSVKNMTTEVGEDYLAFWTNHFSDYVVTKSKTGNPDVPATGDNNEIAGTMMLMLASGTAAAALWLSLRKKKAV